MVLESCSVVVCGTFEGVLESQDQIVFWAMGEFSDPPPPGRKKNQQSLEIKIDGDFCIDIGFLIVSVQSFSKSVKNLLSYGPSKKLEQSQNCPYLNSGFLKKSVHSKSFRAFNFQDFELKF